MSCPVCELGLWDRLLGATCFDKGILISSAVPVLGIWHKYTFEQCILTVFLLTCLGGIFTQHRQLILKNSGENHAPVLWWHDHVFSLLFAWQTKWFSDRKSLLMKEALFAEGVFHQTTFVQTECGGIDEKPFSFARNVVWSPIPCCSFLLHVKQM